jgi:hypothetical protein
MTATAASVTAMPPPTSSISLPVAAVIRVSVGL